MPLSNKASETEELLVEKSSVSQYHISTFEKKRYHENISSVSTMYKRETVKAVCDLHTLSVSSLSVSVCLKGKSAFDYTKS